MNLEELIMFTFERFYHWGFMRQELFNFSPQSRKTKELFDVDFPFRAETDPSDLFVIPPVRLIVTVPTEILDDLEEGP